MIQAEKKLPEGLEEAAKEYEFSCYQRACFHPEHKWPSTTKDAFIAGAEWQKEKTAWIYLKEAKDAVIALEKEKGEPLNPRVAFVNGARWQKQQMLEDAVEGKVFMSFAPGHNQVVMADVDLPTNTKVKVIIVKEDEK